MYSNVLGAYLVTHLCPHITLHVYGKNKIYHNIRTVVTGVNGEIPQKMQQIPEYPGGDGKSQFIGNPEMVPSQDFGTIFQFLATQNTSHQNF